MDSEGTQLLQAMETCFTVQIVPLPRVHAWWVDQRLRFSNQSN
jgi:hypothetical protein